jgi:hypothetical protein
MRLTKLLAAAPVGIVAVLHWHWLKDQVVHCMFGEALRKVWHALMFVLRRRTDSLLGSFAVPLIPDPSAILNITMILGGMASLVCAGMASPRARGILVAGGITAVAVGLSREAARKNSSQQLGLAA